MLVAADDLSKLTLGAGEPFLLQLELQDKTGAVVDLGDRAFALSLFDAGGRTVRQRIDGVVDADARGKFVRFEQDGTWSDGLYGGTSLRFELDERLLRGRDEIAGGAFTIRETAGSVPSLASAPIGAYAVRVVVKRAADGSRSFSRSIVPWTAKASVTPPVPAFTTPPSISPASGTAGATTFTASDGAASNASGYTRRWLLDHEVIGTGATIKPGAAGSLVLEVTAHGPGGDSAPAATGAVTVGAAGPVITPLPSGIAAIWDAASLSGLADGGAVTSWTDGIGGSVATTTGGTSHTYVANSGGLPALRLSKADVLVTAGTNAAATAIASGECGIIVVARNIQDGDGNPCLVSVGNSTQLLMQANTTGTGRYQFMLPCADSGMRTLGYSFSTARASYVMDGVNGTAIAGNGGGATGQIAIGGWQNAGTACCGKADILAVIVFNRAPTAADFKQVHRRYCELLGQARPGGAGARTISFVGDSLTFAYPIDTRQGYPFQLAAGLNLPWGTWDMLGIPGYQWGDISRSTIPQMGNISGATGTRNIVCAFEWANEANSGNNGPQIAAHAQASINALLAQDSSREIILGTSTDQGNISADRVQSRRDYNSALVAGLSSVTTLVRLDLNPNIGVEGSAAVDNGTYFQSDKLHMTQAGYAEVDNGANGFRSAVQARLAAS